MNWLLRPVRRLWRWLSPQSKTAAEREKEAALVRLQAEIRANRVRTEVDMLKRVLEARRRA